MGQPDTEREEVSGAEGAAYVHFVQGKWAWVHRIEEKGTPPARSCWRGRWRSFVLLGLWADYSAAEVKWTGKGKDGLVQKLDAMCTFKRGSKGCQTHIFPQGLHKTQAQKNPPSLNTLELKAIEHTSRVIFLMFGSMRLKVAYLTHTSIQWYKHAHWDKCIRHVSKDNRGKIGLALEFKDYIITFITNDLVFQDQRLRYMYWLHVYAKDAVGIPTHLAALIDGYNAAIHTLGNQPQNWCRDDNELSLYDPFDPIYIQEALESKSLSLGHLIFGEKDWMHLQQQKFCHQATDPLTLMFMERGLLEIETHLPPGYYESLYPSQQRANYVQCPTYAYNAKKQIWSVVQCFPSNSCSTARLEGKSDQGVAIGPLEYCGNGRILQLPSEENIHKADPMLSIRQITQQAKHEFRLKNNLDQPGKAKVAMTERQHIAQAEYIKTAVETYWLSRSLSESCSSSPPSSSPPPSPSNTTYLCPEIMTNPERKSPPRKKRRISADKRIALGECDLDAEMQEKIALLLDSAVLLQENYK
ncbi:hypothetical protein CPB84DRAFT_1850684 [Gymnopilus junonius]|uniref:Uncharacterized protein n=1 Tax=Gymnopilus junonius TaxID=109634 RepID=A0A9P5NGX5_GYMJU|nr:hypothetical protein CPB84DRAFT_1850684 [Gymnopilus junonius]